MGALLFLQNNLFANDNTLDSPLLSASDSIPKVDSARSEEIHSSESNLNKLDTLKEEAKIADTLKKKKVRIPQKATIYSAVLPGLGQAYNHKYWKIPVVYAAAGVTVYYLNSYNKKYKTAKQQYEQEYYKGSAADQNYLNLYADERDFYRKWRDWDVIILSVLYVANIIDAMADAYFTQFDISDNLTLKVEPAMMEKSVADQNKYALGLKLSFRF